MHKIEGILLEPVGCLAEFPADPFHEIAVRFFDRKGKGSLSGSRSYWHLLNLMESAKKASDIHALQMAEIQAVDAARIYEDVRPALAELRKMGVRTTIATSLSRAAVERFLEVNSLFELFSDVWCRDNAGGIKTVPLIRALQVSGLQPDNAIFLTDTLEGIHVARGAGVHPILMMDDPDEARRLVMHNPDGGVVSLHEIPDLVRLITAQN